MNNADSDWPGLKAIAPHISLSLLLTALLSGCGLSEGKNAASSVVANHFQAISTNGHGVALKNYSAHFFQKTPRERWSNTFETFSNNVGPFKSYTIDDWKVFKMTGDCGKGTYVGITTTVTYSRASTREEFTLFKGEEEDAGYKIVGHDIKAKR